MAKHEHGLRWIRLPSGAAALVDPFLGGTVQRLRFAGAAGPIDVLWGDRDPAMVGDDPDLFRGRPLAPFADRIVGGRYSFGGTDYRLPINAFAEESGSGGDAIHGYLYRTPLQIDSFNESGVNEASLCLEGTLPAIDGYPWPLSVHLRYILRDREFVFRIVLRNEGAGDAPVTVGWHSYFLVPGAPIGTPVDSAILAVPASSYFEIDETMRPTGRRISVEGTVLDFRRGRGIGGLELDYGFPLDTGVPLDEGGLLEKGAPSNAHASRAPHGPAAGHSTERVVSLSSRTHQIQVAMHGAFGATQLFIPPGRAAIAIEPISAPAEAFNAPELGLIQLPPGESVEATAVVSLVTIPS
jgi:aldose 1-epimerase